MNKKLIVMLAAVATAGAMFAHPGRGFHHGPMRGPGFRPPPMHGPGFYHHHHHHHYGRGWGVAGAVLGTAALVHDIVRPYPYYSPVVVAPPVVAPAPVVVSPAPVVAPAPVVVSPAPVVYRSW